MIKRFLAILLLFNTFLFAKYVYINENIITPIDIQKIESLGSELYEKTGISLYVAAVRKIEGKSYEEFIQSITKNLKKPYMLLFFSKDDYKVDFITSHKVKHLIDKTSVLIFYGPVIREFFTDKSYKYSSGLFKGYVYVADKVADIYHVKLLTNLGVINKTIYYFFKYTVYLSWVIVLSIFGLFLYRYYKKRQKS